MYMYQLICGLGFLCKLRTNIFFRDFMHQHFGVDAFIRAWWRRWKPLVRRLQENLIYQNHADQKLWCPLHTILEFICWQNLPARKEVLVSGCDAMHWSNASELHTRLDCDAYDTQGREKPPVIRTKGPHPDTPTSTPTHPQTWHKERANEKTKWTAGDDKVPCTKKKQAEPLQYIASK